MCECAKRKCPKLENFAPKISLCAELAVLSVRNANIVTCEPSLRNILLPLHRFIKHFAMALWQTEAY